MKTPESRLLPGTVVLDGCPLNAIRGVNLDCQTFKIHLIDRASISIYTFNSLMLPSEAKRVGVEKFLFSGPRLGIYHDTADIREGPFVNHFLSRLEIEIVYPSEGEASINVKGAADLSQSSVDPYWYKGARAGAWTFEAKFSYRFKDVI